MNAVASSSKTTLDMLGEIKSSTALQIVRAVTYSTAPPGPSFMPSLDRILNVARPHPGESSLQRGDLIELIGSSASGKTTLLSFSLHTSLLPFSMNITLPPPDNHSIQVEIGGKSQYATLLQPTSHRSLVPRIRQAMQAHIQTCILDALSTNLRSRTITSALRATMEHEVDEALERLMVVRFRPRWKYLYMSLLQILHPPCMKMDHQIEREKEALHRRSVDLLVIDGFGDPFWPERLTEEDKSTTRGRYGTGIGGAGAGAAGLSSGVGIGIKEIMGLIQRIRDDLGSVVFLSIQSLWTKASSPFFVPHLPAPYPTPFTVAHGGDRDQESRLYYTASSLTIQLTLLGRVRSLQLPPDLTLNDALKDGSRNRVDGGQRFEGIVRVVGGEGTAGTLAGERFYWVIGPEGIQAEIE